MSAQHGGMQWNGQQNGLQSSGWLTKQWMCCRQQRQRWLSSSTYSSMSTPPAAWLLICTMEVRPFTAVFPHLSGRNMCTRAQIVAVPSKEPLIALTALLLTAPLTSADRGCAGGMHYIADAASHLAEHPDAQHAQYAMHGPPQDPPHHHPAVHQDAQQGAQPQDYSGKA